MIKKIGKSFTVMLIIVTMLSSLFVLTANAAATQAVVRFDGYMSGGEGEAFHKVGHNGEINLKWDSNWGMIIRGGEWVKYPFPAMEPGEYNLYFTRSSQHQIEFNVYINDVKQIALQNVIGTGAYGVTQEVYVGTIKIEEAKPFVMTVENAGASTVYWYSAKLVDKNEMLKKEAFEKKSRPYKMSYLPAILEAEDFDEGASQVAYSDSDEMGTKVYRTNAAVDIFGKDGGGYYIDLITKEWTRRTFKVDNAGNYKLYMNAKDPSGITVARMYIDNKEIVRRIDSRHFDEEFKEIDLGTYYFDEGVHTVVSLCAYGSFSLDYLRFATTSEAGINVKEDSSLRIWEESMLDVDDVLYEEIPEENREEKAPNPIQAQLYVNSKAHSGGDGTEANPFNNIKDAQAAVRKINKDMTGDIIVNLDGFFTINETLEFTNEDSGSNGFTVRWKGDLEKTTISGGEKLTNWEKVGDTGVYKTKVENKGHIRNLYVDENRATPARSKYMYYAKSEYIDPESGVHRGYVFSKEDFKEDFKRPEQMEFCYNVSWKNVRYRIDELKRDENGDYIFIFDEWLFDKVKNSSSYPSIDHPIYFEQTLEFFDTPGEWYYNYDTEEMFYYPTEYENMETSEIYIPRVETLMTLSGSSLDNKISYIDFEGINFKHGAWNEVSETGLCTIQAEMLLSSDGYIPGQIQVINGNNINFDKNRFRQLGSVGLWFSDGTNECRVEGNLFDNISSTAVVIGTGNLQTSDPVEKYARDILVTNNLLRRVSVEFLTNQITAYYTRKVEISHNDMLDCPYTGISMGWGWGQQMDHTGYNKISYNRIINVLLRQKDGGHIYTLNPSTGSLINGNYCVYSSEWKGGIYHDNASAYWTTTGNVFDTYKWMKITWFTVMNNTAYSNYATGPMVVSYPEQNSGVTEAEIISKDHSKWPQKANMIVEKAGLEDEYKYLLDYYASLENQRHEEVEHLDWSPTPGLHIQPGNYMAGGEGVGYHDTLSANTSDSVMGEPTVYDTYLGIGLKYIKVTEEGEWTKYEFEVDEDADYDIYITASTPDDETAASVEVDDKLVADAVKVKNTTSYNIYDENKLCTTNISKGKHTIKIIHAKHNFGFYGLRIVKTGTTEFIRNDGYNHAIIDSIVK